MTTPNISEILNTVNMALSVIRTVTSTPGINAIPYVATASSAIAALQAAIQAGRNIAPYLIAIKDTFSGTTPTVADLAALDAKIAELDAAVDAPLPEREEGEPE